MWEIKLRGFEHLEKKYNFFADEDFIYVYKKPQKLEDSPVGIYSKWADLADVRENLERMSGARRISTYLYKMYRDSSD